MSLIDCRTRFQAGLIDKSHYIEEMYHLHSRLFEYAQFLNQTDISKIEIQDNELFVTLRSSGIKLLCESLDKRAAPIEILNFNSYEKIEADLIFSLIEPHMVFFDVGANIGWYSLNVAMKDSTIKVYAFEPIPDTYQLLKKNVMLNNVKNINLFNIGFSDKNESLTFYCAPFSSASASARNITEHPESKQIISQAEKMDDFFTKYDLEKLDFVKCDVEGAELLVYRGGLETLKKYHPIVFTEMLRKWSKKFGYNPNDIIELFTDLGYRCFICKNGKLVEFFSMNENTIETNFFFLHSIKHASKIQKLSY